jgi:hypothetical protein
MSTARFAAPRRGAAGSGRNRVPLRSTVRGGVPARTGPTPPVVRHVQCQVRRARRGAVGSGRNRVPLRSTVRGGVPARIGPSSPVVPAGSVPDSSRPCAVPWGSGRSRVPLRSTVRGGVPARIGPSSPVVRHVQCQVRRARRGAVGERPQPRAAAEHGPRWCSRTDRPELSGRPGMFTDRCGIPLPRCVGARPATVRRSRRRPAVCLQDRASPARSGSALPSRTATAGLGSPWR